MEFFTACIINPLLLYAVLSGFIASVMGGTVGTFVVVRRITYISGSISHSILGGMGLFLWLERAQGWTSVSPLMGAMISGILSALLINFAKKRLHEREDSLVATLWTFGMASGIIFMSKTPGYSVELTNLLIGNILWVTRQDVLLLISLTICSLLFIIFFFQKLKLMAFDEQEATLQGIDTEKLSLCLLILVSVTVVALMQVVGVVLVTSMLTLPQMIAGLFSKRLSSMAVYSSCISCFLTLIGLMSSFYLDWPAGATIAILSTVAYVTAQTIVGMGRFFKKTSQERR